MKKLLLIPTTITATLVPFITLTSCGKDDPTPPQPDPTKPTEIKINNKPENLNVLQTYQLDVEVLPAEADQNVLYYSSYPTAATVSTTGLISVLRYDELPIEITITSAVDTSIKTKFSFIINKPEIEITFSKNPISVGELSKVAPNSPWLNQVSWEVQQDGEIVRYKVDRAVLEVIGLAKGSATIIAKSTNPDYPDAVGQAVIEVQ